MPETIDAERLHRDLVALMAERAAASTDRERNTITGKMVDRCWMYERQHGEFSSCPISSALGAWTR